MATEGDELAATFNRNPNSPIARWVEHYQSWRQDRIPNRSRSIRPANPRARKGPPLNRFNVSFSLQRVLDSMSQAGVRVVPDNAEFGEVLLLIRLSDARQLYRLRHCEHCSTWYFARRDIQRFCSVNCRVKARISTEPPEARREKHTKYMREYRAREKERDRKGIKQARNVAKGE